MYVYEKLCVSIENTCYFFGPFVIYVLNLYSNDVMQLQLPTTLVPFLHEIIVCCLFLHLSTGVFLLPSTSSSSQLNQDIINVS